jgi:hypothetical protein
MGSIPNGVPEILNLPNPNIRNMALDYSASNRNEYQNLCQMKQHNVKRMERHLSNEAA